MGARVPGLYQSTTPLEPLKAVKATVQGSDRVHLKSVYCFGMVEITWLGYDYGIWQWKSWNLGILSNEEEDLL